LFGYGLDNIIPSLAFLPLIMNYNVCSMNEFIKIILIVIVIIMMMMMMVMLMVMMMMMMMMITLLGLL